MNITTQVLAKVRDERQKRDADAARWAKYRRDANPPAWIVILLVVAGLAGMLVLASVLLQHPKSIFSPLGILIVPVSAFLAFAAKLDKHRQTTLIRIVQEEAPDLYAKLREERLIR
jgi:protein-S-isoprenylcysteine O-methyltransferase Ste14